MSLEDDQGSQAISIDPPSRREGPSWCLFRNDERSLAVPLEKVEEIVSVESLVKFPLGPGRLLGLCALRREVVPVVGLFDSTEFDPDRHVVLITRAGQGTWGIRIDREGTLVIGASLEKPVGDDARVNNERPFLGRVERAGTYHDVVDLETVWHSLRQGGASVRGVRPGLDSKHLQSAFF